MTKVVTGVKIVALDHWPVVTPDDDGIRPAGPPDECLYCHSKVGQEHGRSCVVVECKIRLKVIAEVSGRNWTGVWDTYVPHGWSADDIYFRFNESSWCASNLDLEYVKWDEGHCVEELADELYKTELAQQAAEVRVGQLDTDEAASAKLDESCWCPYFSFEFLETLDYRPHIHAVGVL